MNIFPEIMNEIFDFSKDSVYELRCGKSLPKSNICSMHFGNESIRNIAAKIWNKITNEIKEANSLTVFESKIKKWVPQVCPCRSSTLCSYLVQFLSSCLKNRKKSPLKKFLYFRKMELSGSNMKKFLIFQETKTLKSFLYFKLERIKNFTPKKNSLYFRKWNFLALISNPFQETETSEKIPNIS